MTLIQANGLNFELEIRGEGPQLLVIGGTGWDLRHTPSPLDSLLTEHFKVAFYDQRGMGRSDKPSGPYTMTDYALDARCIIDALGWHRPHILGYSFGGMVAQELAINWPEHLDHLVLAATSPGGKNLASYPIEKFLDLEPFDRARKGLEVADSRFTIGFQESHPEQAQLTIKKRMAKQARFMHETRAEEGLRAQLKARASHDTCSRLVQITAPTLIIAGRFDGQTPKAGHAELQDQINGAQIHIVDGSHNFIFENDECYSSVVQFCTTA